MEDHTEGPWKVWHDRSIVQEGDEGTIIVQKMMLKIRDERKEFGERKANAHLIAASTELLAACKYVVQYHRENDTGEGELYGLDFVTTCIAAIRKAEGKL